MANNENELREEFEKLANSEYSSFLISKHIDEVAKKKWSYLRWVVATLVAVFAFLNIQLYNGKQQVEDLNKNLLGQLDSLSDIQKQIANEAELQQALMAFQQEKSEFYNRINERNIQSIDSKFKEVDEFKVETKKLTDRNNDSLKTFREDVEVLKETIGLQLVDLDSIEISVSEAVDSIGTIENKVNQNQLNSSMKYVHIEKGDSRFGTNKGEYRPVEISVPSLIPGEHLDLKFVFFNSSKRGGKKAYIDFYIDGIRKNVESCDCVKECKHKEGCEGALFLNESSSAINSENKPESILNIQGKKEFVFNHKGTDYKIEPVFVYLPPNPLLFRIPDYVVLKISLQSEED